jgi:hypothetical protein
MATGVLGTDTGVIVDGHPHTSFDAHCHGGLGTDSEAVVDGHTDTRSDAHCHRFWTPTLKPSSTGILTPAQPAIATGCGHRN